jgi:hypothetical protein
MKVGMPEMDSDIIFEASQSAPRANSTNDFRSSAAVSEPWRATSWTMTQWMRSRPTADLNWMNEKL